MALVPVAHSVSQATDPTIPLTEALATFEQALTGEQRQKYRDSATKPDPADVIAFVTQIDINNQNQAKRCVASRLSTFLQATQQFVGVADTFVGSNPAIAALVWGSVKFTIVSVSNVVSYFDQVTALIMNIGKLCPIFQQFGKLFVGSVELQRALCEYYATIVRLCIKVLEVSQRKALTQLLRSAWAPFETEFKNLRDELEQSAKVVDLHISLASKQANNQVARMVAFEHKENQKHRLLSLSSRSEMKQEREEAKQWRLWYLQRESSRLRASIKENLSPANHLKAWRHIYQQRAPGTAEWLQQDPAYVEWRKSEHTQIMWCPGTLGVGKTVLAANIVASLQAQHTPNDIVSYHFCRWEDRVSLEARMILGSLARQMMEDQIDNLSNSDLTNMNSATEGLEDAEIVDFLLPQLRDGTTYYIIVDGLDESDDREIETVAYSIAELCRGHSQNLKIMCIGRPELESRLFKWIAFDHKIAISRLRVMEDVDQYLMISLNQCLEEGKLRLNDPTLILQISETLRGESEEIFLWTKLFIEEMCAQHTDNQILDALKNPPRKISELIDRKLTRVMTNSAAAQAIKVLRYCGILKLPLNIDQYRELLTIEIGQAALDRRSLPNDMNEPVNACHGLIFVDEEDETLHFAHHSIWNHVLTSGKLHAYIIDEVQLDIHLGSLCLTYLNFTDFQRQLKRQKESFTVPIRPIHFGITPVAKSNNLVAHVAQKLLRNQSYFRGLSGQEMEQKAQEILGESISARLEAELQSNKWSFLEYARTQWIHHFARLEIKLDPKLWRILGWCVQDDNLLALKPWQTELKSVSSANRQEKGMYHVFVWSLKHANNGLLLYLVLDHWSNLTETERDELIISKEFPRHLQPIMSHIFTTTSVQIDSLQYIFHDAAVTGQDLPLELCMKAGVSVNSKTTASGQFALYIASQLGHVNLVEKLISAGANLEAIAWTSEGTALLAATGNNHVVIVEKLLAAGASVNATAFVERGQSAVYPTLNFSTRRGSMPGIRVTPLLLAAANGNLDILEALLSAKADIHYCVDRTEGTALHMAATMGHLDIVKKLLSIGSVTGDYGPDPQRSLRLAAYSGHLHVVEYLLSIGFDVDAVDSEEWNALGAAVDGGSYAVVQRLLVAGANPKTSFIGLDQYRPLIELATERGDIAIANLLARSGPKRYNWPSMMTGDSIGQPDD